MFPRNEPPPRKLLVLLQTLYGRSWRLYQTTKRFTDEAKRNRSLNSPSVAGSPGLRGSSPLNLGLATANGSLGGNTASRPSRFRPAAALDKELQDAATANGPTISNGHANG